MESTILPNAEGTEGNLQNFSIFPTHVREVYICPSGYIRDVWIIRE